MRYQSTSPVVQYILLTTMAIISISTTQMQKYMGKYIPTSQRMCNAAMQQPRPHRQAGLDSNVSCSVQRFPATSGDEVHSDSARPLYDWLWVCSTVVCFLLSKGDRRLLIADAVILFKGTQVVCMAGFQYMAGLCGWHKLLLRYSYPTVLDRSTNHLHLPRQHALAVRVHSQHPIYDPAHG